MRAFDTHVGVGEIRVVILRLQVLLIAHLTRGVTSVFSNVVIFMHSYLRSKNLEEAEGIHYIVLNG